MPIIHQLMCLYNISKNYIFVSFELTMVVITNQTLGDIPLNKNCGSKQ